MEEEGAPITEAEFLRTFGQRNDAILGAWFGPNADPDRIRRVGDAKESRYRALVEADGIAALPGAAEWVGALHAGGWLQAIASSAPRLNVEAVRRALDFSAVMEAVVGAEDVSAGKPDPEVFLTAAARLGVPPGRCVVVEDAAAGIEAARRAGMRSIGVGGAAATGADVVVESLAALPAGAFDRLLDRDSKI
jgi:HAD superfamily hydrolase (TIGR01509 family)